MSAMLPEVGPFRVDLSADGACLWDGITLAGESLACVGPCTCEGWTLLSPIEIRCDAYDATKRQDAAAWSYTRTVSDSQHDAALTYVTP